MGYTQMFSYAWCSIITLDDLTIYLWVAFLVWTFFHIFLQSALVVVDGRLTLIVVFNLCGWSYQIFLQAITNP